MTNGFLFFLAFSAVFLLNNVASVRICSFNIYSGKNIDKVYNIRKQGEILAGLNLDFVGLQEVDNNTVRSYRDDQLSMLARFAGTPYKKYLPLMNYSQGKYGIGAMSKHTVTDSFVLKFNQSSLIEQRGLVGLRFTVSQTNFWMLNTHFSHVDPDTKFSAAVQTIAKVKQLKIKYPQDRFFVMGDLNVTPGGRVEKHLMTYFTDAWTSCGGGSQGFTHNSRNPSKRIDYILADRPIRNCKAQIVNTMVSDHRPVVLEF